MRGRKMLPDEYERSAHTLTQARGCNNRMRDNRIIRHPRDTVLLDAVVNIIPAIVCGYRNDIPTLREGMLRRAVNAVNQG